MDERTVLQEALFNSFSDERHVRRIICCARSIGSLIRRSPRASAAVYSETGAPLDRS